MECLINEADNCDLYKNIQIGSLATMTVGMLLAILSRPGGTGIKLLDEYDEEKMFDDFVEGFDAKPRVNAGGVGQEGFEWGEHPPNSNTWFTRPVVGGPWKKYKG